MDTELLRVLTVQAGNVQTDAKLDCPDAHKAIKKLP